MQNASTRNVVRRMLRLLLGYALASTAAGCSSVPSVMDFDIEPWVKPYERNQLADPLMSFNRDPISSTYLHHVRQAREGARGAEGGAGGGCGCN